MISAILACKIREATITFNWKRKAQFLSAARRTDAQRERERCACWERETSRSRGSQHLQMHNILATSRIHKKHVQLGHADGCRGYKQVNSNRSRIRAECASCRPIWKAFLGALGFWGPKAVAYLCLMAKSASGWVESVDYIRKEWTK